MEEPGKKTEKTIRDMGDRGGNREDNERQG